MPEYVNDGEMYSIKDTIMTLEDYKNEGYHYGINRENEKTGRVWAESPAPDIMSIESTYCNFTGDELDEKLLEILAKLKEAYTNKNHK